MKNPHSSCSLTSHSYEGAESNEERDSSCPNLWLLRLQISRNRLTFIPDSRSKSKFVAKIPLKESNCVADRFYVYKYRKEFRCAKSSVLVDPASSILRLCIRLQKQTPRHLKYSMTTIFTLSPCLLLTAGLGR